MASVRSKNTAPELIVRKLLHRMGYRYRLHMNKLPGSPDLVFPTRKKIVFVHGCFWHRHEGCRYATIPKTRKNFWKDKFNANIIRDRLNQQELEKLGWKILTVWQCELKNLPGLIERFDGFFKTENQGSSKRKEI